MNIVKITSNLNNKLNLFNPLYLKTKKMDAEQKAKELINMYYGCNDTNQLGAIEMVERVLLGTLCEKIDSLHSHVFIRKDFDLPLIESQIQQLKNWQEVAAELQNIKTALLV